MNIESQEMNKTNCPNGGGLLVLGLLSLFFGPLTAIPGLLFSAKFKPFSGAALVGYFLCWLFLVFDAIAVLLYVLMH